MHYALGVSGSDYPQGSPGASCAQLLYSCQAALPASCSPTCAPTLPMPGLSIPLLGSDVWLSSSNLIFHPSSGLLPLEEKEGRRSLWSSLVSLLPLKLVAPSGYRTGPELYWVRSPRSSHTHAHKHTHTHTLSLPTVSDGQCFCPKVRTLVGIAGWAWMLT